jgi:hypothetical protein
MAKRFAGFTPDQEFTLLAKMGYQGPKDTTEMEKFKASSPGVSARMGKLAQKANDRFMPKMAEGGLIETPNGWTFKGTSQTYDTLSSARAAYDAAGNATTQTAAPNTTTGTQPTTPPATQPAGTTTLTDGTQAQTVTAEQATQTAIQNPMDLVTAAVPQKVEQNADQIIDPNTGQVQAPDVVTPETVTETAQATAPEKTETNTVDATKIADQVKAETDALTAAKAEPSKAATVQGQLEGLMAQFEGGATPPWADGAMRQAMTVMQQRGLGASSMAGAAVVQAAMESAIAIASQDAATVAQFEMKNLDNEQQTLIFKTQQRIAGLFSDQAADNAAKQFNAASKNQTDQFFAGLQESVSRFNADQINSIRQFNAGQTNAVEQFNSQIKAQRDQFNATNSLVIAQANAKWRQDIATMDAAAANEANMLNAKNATQMTQLALDNLWQQERDIMAFTFTAYQSDLDRKTQLMIADKSTEIAKMELKAQDKAGLGSIVGSIVGKLFG